jgi:hypothetical protein
MDRMNMDWILDLGLPIETTVVTGQKDLKKQINTGILYI